MPASHELHALRQAQIDRLARLPHQLARLTATVDERESTTPFLVGEWSIAQNLHHLADSHMNNFIRCKLILTESEPTLPAYDRDGWVALADSRTASVSATVELLQGLHTRWVSFWKTVAEDEWQRSGLHPETGRITLADILRNSAAHGGNHLAMIRRTLFAQYSGLPTSPEDLLARIDREWDRLQKVLPDKAAMHTSFDGSWSPKIQIAHLTLWETYLLRHLIGGEPAHSVLELPPNDDLSAQLDAVNAADAARAQSLPIETVSDKAHHVHAAVRSAILSLNWPEWVRRDNNGELPVSGLIAATYEHYLEHWQSLL